MQFRIVLLSLVIVTGTLISTHNTQAADVKLELPLQAVYDLEKDPYLVEWTFAIEDEAKQPEVPVEEMSAEDKILARWKTKQAHLWKTLPTGKFTINASAYTAAADECGKSDGITASGIKVTEKRTLACPPAFPFGTKIAIEGMGTYQCEDRGGAIKGNKFDIYMETKQEAFAFGRRNLTAEVIQ